MIYFKNPYIKQGKNKSKLIYEFNIDNEKKKVWFEVDNKYKKYLCDDRVDAIVIGMLSYAMRNNHDIKSDSYLTDEIYYKLTNYLIPTLSKYSDELHSINISIQRKSAIKNAGAVGTGCSCGIDSLHAFLNHYKESSKQYKLTHLCINNVGAFNETYKEEGIDKVRKERYKKSIEFAKEVNLPLIVTNSNFLDEIPQVHLYTHTYSSTFAILCLQKLWKVYYYGSSGFDFSAFTIKNTAELDCAEYELLSLDCFSTNNLKIYSEGAAYDRLEKTIHVCKSDLFKNHLHVCLKKAYNCSVCDKCKRTMMTLYALNLNMNDYKNIFDIDYFEKNKAEYFEWLCEDILWNPDTMNYPVYNLLLTNKEFKKYADSFNKKNKTQKEIDYHFEYENIINSKAYKLGNKLLCFPRKIKKIIKRR